MKKLNIDLQEVKKLYESGMTCGQIAEKFNCSVSCIEQKVKMVTTIRKRSDYGRKKFNENFFEVIDSEIKAYWLGFIYADGCVYTHGNTKYISIKVQDKEICDNFIRDIEGDFTTKTYMMKKTTNSEERREVYFAECSSNKMFSDLNKLGVVERKSLILTFPTEQQVPKHLIPHFIRGYFDGDGTVITGARFGHTYSKVKTPYIKIGFNGTKEMLEGINKYIPETMSIHKEKRRPDTNTYFCYKSGTKTIKKIFDYLYKDATVYLSRKYQKFKDYYKI